ncbi:hypothetical protein ACIPJS_06335 [Streptomyces sp. NPDC086783]|uniref:hypothetical protein n=1 Tax=Streptomyces sp. NPDC086783 TaxID=3365758 RepID=UPI0037F50A26
MSTDLDASAADAGAPASDPGWGDAYRDAPPDSPLACVVAYKGFGTHATPVNAARFTAMVAELHERKWRQSRKRTEEKDREDGQILLVRTVLKQRGWTMVAEYRYRSDKEDGVITANAFNDGCIKKNGSLTDLAD